MFNRLAAVKIKAAEEALTAGRLEEALDVVLTSEVGEHRQLGQLREVLSRRFFERGQDRLLNRLFKDALADFDRAGQCGAPASAVEEWRRRAKKAMEDDVRAHGEKQAALIEARRKLADGSIVGARDALAKSPLPDVEEKAVSAEIERQHQRASQALESARAAFEQGQLTGAVEHLLKAKACHGKAEGVAELESKIVDNVLRQGREAFTSGRLDRAEQYLTMLGEIGRSSPARVEFEEALRISHDAARAMTEDRYGKASVLLGRLEQMGIKADWTSEARRQLDAAESQRRALLSGPLGLLAGESIDSAIDLKSKEFDETRINPGQAVKPPPIIAPQIVRQVNHHGLLPRRLMLRIDGVGSFLLLRGDRVSIGRSGASSSPDLELMSDLSERHAEIVRAGEDYFVVSMAGVELAGRPVDHALLQDGDRIRLGPRVRMKFLRPSLKSAAAILDLGDGVRTLSDCRRVILWTGPLLLGNSRECHVPIRSMGLNSVLLERDGRMVLRNVGLGAKDVALTLGATMDFGDLRLSVQDASAGSRVGKVIG